MLNMEETLVQWRKEEAKMIFDLVQDAITVQSEEKDIVKQKDAADFFQISVNTLKDWVRQGAPEIRLESGMPFYSKKAIRNWLLEHQK